MLHEMKPALDPQRVIELIEQAAGVYVSEPVLDYIQALVAATRSHAAVKAGLSPRAALALIQTARAHALVMQQDFCLPDNVRTVFPALAAHRLQPAAESSMDGDAVAAEILESTPVP